MGARYVFNPKSGKMEVVIQANVKNKTPNKPELIKVEKKEEEKQQNNNGVNLLNEVERRTSNLEIEENTVMFRERSDLTIFQITDESTGMVLAYISGYALDINFNVGELRSVERVEQLIEGIGKLFRNIVMEKILNK